MRALRAFAPEVLVIEAPADAVSMATWVGHEALHPPVAMLVYNPKDFAQASFFPFAAFSPEWQALLFAQRHNLPVRFMDLPMGIAFALRQKEYQAVLPFGKSDPERAAIRQDPLGYLARLAGYTDGERWWEATFESREYDGQTFDLILELMQELRQETAAEELPETLLREAWMRRTLRRVLKEGFERIAVVCGAWHAPALADVDSRPAAPDNALLRGLKKVKTAATWVPWTYLRLATSSGYGAGVRSPAWYELLFQQRDQATVRWMVRVARLMRQQGWDASTAHALEAVRLAQSLAALRQLALPGIDELTEAALAVLGQGQAIRLQLIEQQLVIGDKTGRVPSELPHTPLQADLQKAIKSARLSKYWGEPEPHTLTLDLRKPINLAASVLLHRLTILGIDWAELRTAQKGTRKGSFGEAWHMHWRPELSLQIIEASVWGSTVWEAAHQALLHQAKQADTLPALVPLVQQALLADLRDVWHALVPRLQQSAALTTDITHFLEGLPALVSVVRYGHTRQTDRQAVLAVIDELVPRLCIGLSAACVQLDEEASRGFFANLLRAHQAIQLLPQSRHRNAWFEALDQLSVHERAAPMLRGAALRLLFDKSRLAFQEVARRMAWALSGSWPLASTAQWLEGFLHGSGLVLVHYRALWHLLDEWVSQLTSEAFRELLPSLRRAFSHFTPAERQQMWTQLHASFEPAVAPQHTWDEQRAVLLDEMLNWLLSD